MFVVAQKYALLDWLEKNFCFSVYLKTWESKLRSVSVFLIWVPPKALLLPFFLLPVKNIRPSHLENETNWEFSGWIEEKNMTNIFEKIEPTIIFTTERTSFLFKRRSCSIRLADCEKVLQPRLSIKQRGYPRSCNYLFAKNYVHKEISLLSPRLGS